VEEVRCRDHRIHADLLETAVHFRCHDRGTIDLGDATGMPEEGEHWLIGHRLTVGQAVPLDIRMRFAA
jgi:hypothetical protein